MTKAQAAELILAGRRAAARVGKDFVVDTEKLGRNGGFSQSEIDQINEAVSEIESDYARVMHRLR